MARKSFIPLESNPDVFNTLTESLGVSAALRFQDVWTLADTSELLSAPVLALVLVFPTPPSYEARVRAEDANAEDWMVTHNEEDEDAMWFKQTIHNACGLYAILHALANGRAKDFIRPGSVLDILFSITAPMDPPQAALVLESSKDLEAAYNGVARQGSTAAPAADDEVEFHYICFVKSPDTGHLFELDGGRKGPVDRGVIDEEERVDLGPKSLDLVREYIEKGEEDVNYSLMALVEAPK
ncbi:hypothetical protein ACHAQA_008199 [Verticillium albo-atrum]